MSCADGPSGNAVVRNGDKEPLAEKHHLVASGQHVLEMTFTFEQVRDKISWLETCI